MLKVCRIVLIQKLVPEASQQMPSFDRGLKLNLSLAVVVVMEQWEHCWLVQQCLLHGDIWQDLVSLRLTRKNKPVIEWQESYSLCVYYFAWSAVESSAV